MAKVSSFLSASMQQTNECVHLNESKSRKEGKEILGIVGKESMFKLAQVMETSKHLLPNEMSLMSVAFRSCKDSSQFPLLFCPSSFQVRYLIPLIHCLDGLLHEPSNVSVSVEEGMETQRRTEMNKVNQLNTEMPLNEESRSQLIAGWRVGRVRCSRKRRRRIEEQDEVIQRNGTINPCFYFLQEIAS